MLIFPAIDLRKGKCVRLVQGRAKDETVYNEDPVAVALRWKKEGAEWLHLVDLDGAFALKILLSPLNWEGGSGHWNRCEKPLELVLNA